MSVTKEVPIPFPVKISRTGLEQLCEEITKLFGPPRFTVTYMDKTRATFDTLERLLHSNLTKSLDINRLEIEAGSYNTHEISLVLDNERRHSRIELELNAEGASTEFETRAVTILKGMAPPQGWFRTTPATFFLSFSAIFVTYTLFVLFATRVLKLPHIPFYLEILAFAIGYLAWGAHTNLFPWVAFAFAGVRDKYATARANGTAILLGIVTYYITKFLDFLFTTSTKGP